MEDLAVLPLSEISPYSTSLIFSCIEVRVLRRHASGPRCSHLEIVDAHGTPAYLRVLTCHPVVVPDGSTVRMNNIEVQVEPGFSVLSNYMLSTTPYTEVQALSKNGVFPVRRPIVSGGLKDGRFRKYDIEGLVERVDRLTQQKSSAVVNGIRVFTGPGCPRLAPGQFFRAYGVSRMAADRVYVPDPGNQVDVGGSENCTVPVGELTSRYRRQKAPMTADVVGILATRIPPRGPAVRTIGLRSDAKTKIELDIKKVPIEHIKGKKVGDKLKFGSVRVSFPTRGSSTVAYWTSGTSQCALE